MVRDYYRLVKPGIVYGNVFTALAGFLYASKLVIAPMVLASVLVGMSFVIAAACVFNNMLDRHIDARMERTKSRPLVTGAITMRAAAVFGTLLLTIGAAVLYVGTNLRTLEVGLFGVVWYVAIYGYAKRRSHIGTLVGSISGAVPILAGYTASTGMFGTSGWVIFFAMVLWQMPHFYTIAIYRMKEYAAAGIPVLPSVIGLETTKIAIAVYVAVFVFAESVLTLIHRTGTVYLFVVLVTGAAWFAFSLYGFETDDSDTWARQMFLVSLIVLLVFSVAISFGRVLP